MKKIVAALSAVGLLGALAAAPAGATNGMNMIGYSTRATGMGGADVAVDSDASAVGGNPAVISTASPSSATVQITPLMPVLNYKDPANDVDGDRQIFPMPMLGYVHKIGATPWSVGVGVFAQGGMGVKFEDVMTQAGTTDEMTSLVQFMRLNPVVAYKVNDQFNVGATVMVGYAMVKMSMFPATEGGFKVEDLASFGYAGRIGAQYKPTESLRIGATYTTKSSIDLDGGTATLNFGTMGGTQDVFVKYDAAIEDFTWPQEIEAGVAYLPMKGVTLAADVKWINWSATLDKPQLKLSNPNVAVPPGYEAMTNEFDMGWDDQLVFAVGAEYAINAMHTVRAGVNYGKNPVPDANLNPLFPAIPEFHATLGYGLNMGKWLVDAAFEHAFEKSQKNSMMPIEIAHSQNTFSLAVSYLY